LARLFCFFHHKVIPLLSLHVWLSDLEDFAWTSIQKHLYLWGDGVGEFTYFRIVPKRWLVWVNFIVTEGLITRNFTKEIDLNQKNFTFPTKILSFFWRISRSCKSLTWFEYQHPKSFLISLSWLLMLLKYHNLSTYSTISVHRMCFWQSIFFSAFSTKGPSSQVCIWSFRWLKYTIIICIRQVFQLHGCPPHDIFLCSPRHKTLPCDRIKTENE
jgi:hypothetical protein